MAKRRYGNPHSKHGVEIRLAGRQADLVRQIKEGEENLDDWDIEELTRGYRRDKGGKFRGRPPLVVPLEVHNELAKRVKSHVAHQLRGIVAEHVEPVIKRVLAAESLDPEEVPGLRLQAQVAQDLLDRFVVSKTEKVEISGTMKHEEIIEQVTVARDLPSDEEITDADIVEDDEEEDEDDEFEF